MFANTLKSSEYFAISRRLEQYHSIFYKMWEMGYPTFTKKVGGQPIETACVTFNKEGEFMGFCFNPDFWDKLTDYDRIFVIAHESLHVLLNHGIRMKGTLAPYNNMAMDIVVHNILFGQMMFDFDSLSKFLRDMLCTIESCFKQDAPYIEKDECFEYYYKELMKRQSCGPAFDSHETLVIHGSKQLKELLDKLGEQLSPDECRGLERLVEFVEQKEQELKEYLEAGPMGGSEVARVKVKYNPKPKWETVIKKWSLKYARDFKDKEQWARKNRRTMTLSSSLILPSDVEVEHYEDKRIKVWFFQDTSGSCAKFKDRFFTAAASLPKERFEMRLFCFDTAVYETTLESGKLYGFGGTMFTCIEEKVQQLMKNENIPYPEAIFVITDGYGNLVKPEKPKKWYWFLSENYTACIPKESPIFNLRDFE